MSYDLLIEIGVEELPISEAEEIIDKLETDFYNFLQDNNITFVELFTTGTSRRITLICRELSETQEDRITKQSGPPEKIGFDDNGNPTKAALGFCKKFGKKVSDIKIEDTEKGRYLVLEEITKGADSIKLIKERFEDIINSINIRKKMRWDSSGFSFSRPIRWILALAGNKILPLKIGNVRASNYTFGHRFLSKRRIGISNIDEYYSELEHNYVIVDHLKRKKMIVESIEKLVDKETETVDLDNELINLINFLVEYPSAFKGSYDKEFTELPEKILVSTMKTHQKYFPVYDKEKNILPFFIGVSNMPDKFFKNIVPGNEKVIKARLDDARFYFEKDKEKDLDYFIEKEKESVYIDGIGSIFDKTERIGILSEQISDTLNLSEEKKELIKETAAICKADLMSGMVYEFPHLQGYMGKIYALLKNKNKKIADAVYEHYLPAGDLAKLPSNEIGSIISTADKIDSIVCCFILDLLPTGSKDPYALRRAARGFLSILLHNKYSLKLDSILEKSLQLSYKYYIKKEKSNINSIKEKLFQFIEDRIFNLFIEKGYSIDETKSVILVDNKSWDIIEYQYKLEALAEIKNDENLGKVSTGFKRVNNILKNEEPGQFNEKLLSEEHEINLYNVFKKIKDSSDKLILNKDFKNLIRELASLGSYIDTYFDEVLVMDKDTKIKNNRLAMLNEITSFYRKIYDFTYIVSLTV